MVMYPISLTTSTAPINDNLPSLLRPKQLPNEMIDDDGRVRKKKKKALKRRGGRKKSILSAIHPQGAVTFSRLIEHDFHKSMFDV